MQAPSSQFAVAESHQQLRREGKDADRATCHQLRFTVFVHCEQSLDVLKRAFSLFCLSLMSRPLFVHW